MRSILTVGLVSIFGFTTLEAQGLGVAAHVGTLGIGADIAVSAGSRLGFRAGANFFPIDVDVTADDLDYTVDLPSPQFTLLADLYLVGALRVSAGLFASSDDVNLVGELNQDVEIGGGIYTPQEVGQLTGAIINDDFGPYIGIGVGNPTASRIGFFLDLGVAFQGTPVVELDVTGPVSSLPGFQADLEAERQGAEEDVEFFRYYPVLSVGVSFRLGR